MTYGVIAILLLILAVVWYVVTGRPDKRIAELEAVISKGEDDLFSSLLKNSPKVAENVSDVTFLLLKSIMANRVSMVQDLLDLGHPVAEIQLCAVDHGVDLLSAAIETADADVLRMLMAAGMKETSDVTPPVLTCYAAGKPEHLKILQMFEATELSSAQKQAGLTPLHVAALSFAECPEVILAMIQPLLESGADVNAMTAGGNTPLDMAMDKTHVGAGDVDALVKLLLAHGARRGRSLRVPVPCYTGRVFYEGTTPVDSDIELPSGVQLVPHAEETADLADADFPQEFTASDAGKAALRAHRSYVSLCVQGKPGEDPLEVAGRGLGVLTALSKATGVVGVQFEKTLLVPSEYVLVDEDGSFSPLLYTDLRIGRTLDKMILVDTAGLSRFGLPEVELIVADKNVRKDRNAILSGLLADLSATVLAGSSAWEAGHTASLRGMFCRIGYGKHAITENEGFVFLVEKTCP